VNDELFIERHDYFALSEDEQTRYVVRFMASLGNVLDRDQDAASAQAREKVWHEVQRRTGSTVRRAYAAHMALRQVDWSIRHRTPTDVDQWIKVASEFLDN
jgi:hypothetical protein